MAGVAASDGYPALLGGVALAGALGASGIAASGRAVFHWFPRDERGLALGLRQTAVPVGAAAASFSLPPLAAGAGLDAALYARRRDVHRGGRRGDLAARGPAHQVDGAARASTQCAIRASGGSAPRRR